MVLFTCNAEHVVSAAHLFHCSFCCIALLFSLWCLSEVAKSSANTVVSLIAVWHADLLPEMT